MTNFEWLLSLDIDTFTQFLQHTIFVRNLKTGDKSDVGVKTFVNAGLNMKDWLNKPQEFEVEDPRQNERRMTMKTMRDKVLSIFPNAEDKFFNTACPYLLDRGCEKCDSPFISTGNCDRCWNQPVPPECYKNVTIIIDGDDISWVRQDNTERISEEEAMKGVKIKVKANE